MKEVKQEHIQYTTVYEAIDGTIFTSSEECKKYENSALVVMRGKLTKMIVSEEKDAWELMGGYDDNKVVAVAFTKEKDIDTFLQWLYLEHSWYLGDQRKSDRERIEKIAHDAYTQKDVILLGINCDGDYYFINSRNNIIANLNILGKENVNATERKDLKGYYIFY